MMVFRDILFGVGITSVVGDTGIQVAGIQFNSKLLKPAEIFVAVSGTQVDGHQFISNAVGAGAGAIVCEVLPDTLVDGICYIQVADSRKALAILASNYYGNPSKDLKLVGVTGTNGKTTVSSLLYHLFKMAGYKVGLISTIKILVDDKVYDTQLTTPDSLIINQRIKEMTKAGCEYCFMEVSSHGIDQKRTEGLFFTGAIFTNITHDHLDYHKTFAAYRDTKKKLFDQLPKTAWALSNFDDKNGAFMLQNTAAKKMGYALKQYTDFKGQILEQQLSGQLLKIEQNEVWSKLIGDFNAYNLLAIYGAGRLLGLEQLELLQFLSQLENVKGRFQYFISPNKIMAIVDYAHTPDALNNVLNTINALRTGNESVITVVGCGGDRDNAKRPVMGHIASSMSQVAIFTSDNPRTESPESILAEMEKGVEPQNTRKVLVIENRKQAIKTACKMAVPSDVILIAGKGHENYQEIMGVKHPFDDYEEVKRTLIELQK